MSALSISDRSLGQGRERSIGRGDRGIDPRPALPTPESWKFGVAPEAGSVL